MLIRRLFILLLLVTLGLLLGLPETNAPDSLEGSLIGTFIDYEDGRCETSWELDVPGRGRVPLAFTEGLDLRPLANLRTYSMKGELQEGVYHVNDIEPLSSPDRTLSQHALGSKKLAVIMINFQNRQLNVTPAQIADRVYYDLDGYSLETSYQASSYGQLTFPADSNGDGAADVFGPYTIPFESTSYDDCDAHTWAAAALEAAWADNFYQELYDLTLYILPSGTVCRWAGLASGTESWARSYGQPIVHEIGHNLGLGHGHYDMNNDGTDEGGEYADDSTPMGNGSAWVQFTAAHKYALGWFADFGSRVLGLSTAASLTEQLSALELHPSLASGLQIIRIPSGKYSDYYYVSLRRALGPFGNLGSTYADKVQIHRHYETNFNPAGVTRLIAQLNPGSTFQDTESDLQISRGSDVDGNALVSLQFTPRDTDGDGQLDIVDENDDNDVRADSMDCAPRDAYLFYNLYFFPDPDFDGLRDNNLYSPMCIGNSVPVGYVLMSGNNPLDNCPGITNVNQADLDADGLGDACDSDLDGDGTANPSDCAPSDGSRYRNTVYPDADRDGARDSNTSLTISCFGSTVPSGYSVSSYLDNCVGTSNASQSDLDADNLGDACDSDMDGDGALNSTDCLPADGSRYQSLAYSDLDNDGVRDSTVASSLACFGSGCFDLY